MAEETEVVFLSAEGVARMLTDAADGLTTSEYTRMLEDVLGNVESDLVASIAEHMSRSAGSVAQKVFALGTT
jgi:hypothetical protein